MPVVCGEVSVLAFVWSRQPHPVLGHPAWIPRTGGAEGAGSWNNYWPGAGGDLGKQATDCLCRRQSSSYKSCFQGPDSTWPRLPGGRVCVRCYQTLHSGRPCYARVSSPLRWTKLRSSEPPRTLCSRLPDGALCPLFLTPTAVTDVPRWHPAAVDHS